MKNSSYKYKLYGAILGDLCGQPYEFKKNGYNKPITIHNLDSHITDDTLMTLATAKAIINNTSMEKEYKDMGERYPGDYYGSNFAKWLKTPIGTVGNSYGNGCLMRISPIMYMENTLPRIMESVLCSHNHHVSIESVIKLYYAYNERYISDNSHIVNTKRFKVEANATVDFCLELFYQYNIPNYFKMSMYDWIIYMVDRGGDTDTNASIIGELCNFYEKDITEKDAVYVEGKLDDYLLSILKEFNNIQ